MADKNKNNYIWIGIAVVAVIVLAIVFISNSNRQQTSYNGNALNQISITQNNFVYVLDKSGKRVVVLQKDGKYEDQYVSDKIGEALPKSLSENILPATPDSF